MKLKSTLFSIFLTTLIALTVWMSIFFYTDPNKADRLTFAAFYAALFLFISGILTIVIFYLRIFLTNKEIVFSHLSISVRQALLLGLVFTLLLFLQGLGVLTWWDAGLVLVSAILIETYFSSTNYYLS